MSKWVGRYTDAELSFGYAVGAARCDWNRNRGHPDRLGHRDVVGGDRLASHVTGALGELSVAEATGLKWRPLWLALDKTAPDVGNLHVRATRHVDGCLPIQRDDRELVPDAPFVLVTIDERRWRIVGWLYARDAHWNRTRNPNGQRASRFIPQGALCPMFACPVEGERVTP